MDPPPKARGGGGGTGGEIVKVQGGHILRATGRKDRHSKVYTAKGPRDRRVRLSAHTAIQFYDVQDRLGYDRPSKAVDWLIKKARSAIDKLAELPPFEPTADLAVAGGRSGGGEQSESSWYETQHQGHHNQPPPSEDFVSESMAFHRYPYQDLCLSMQSFQNPGLIHGQWGPGNPNSHHAIFPVGFEPGSTGGEGGGSWPSETNPAEMGRFSRLLAWTGGGGGAYGYGGDRGTLQSSFQYPPPSTAGIGVLGSEGFTGFCVSGQMHGGEEGVHGTVAHHHNRASSMFTDSSR